MSTHSTQVEIDSAMAGMVLSEDLLDGAGNVLLPQGVVLTAASLSSLRRRGVEQLAVACEAPPALDAQALARERERLQYRLTRLYRHSAEQSATPALLALLRAYRAKWLP